MEPEVRALWSAASTLYLKAGHYPYHFARSKLRFDPVFFAFLRCGLIPDGARVIDLGCGQSLLAAVLVAARRQFESGVWPKNWPAPPAGLHLRGIELQDQIAQWGRVALGKDVQIETGDICGAVLPEADVIVLLDVLHYLETDAQVQVLKTAVGALKAGGRLLMRVADASAGLSFHLTRLADRLGTLSQLGQRNSWPRMKCRTASEWTALLTNLGFQVEVEGLDNRTPRANVLLHARIGFVGKRSGLTLAS
jgi:SAM-dependent methyltransferase